MVVAHERDGWICAAADAESIADGLMFFLTRPAERLRAGNAARTSADAFDEQRFASAWAAVFAIHELEPSNALC